ncbi:hypothetical protein ACJX0J_017778, partial [Zea mays]
LLVAQRRNLEASGRQNHSAEYFYAQVSIVSEYFPISENRHGEFVGVSVFYGCQLYLHANMGKQEYFVNYLFVFTCMVQ